MAWEHYERHMTGKVAATCGGRALQYHFEIGAITTGRQRVFSRFFVRVKLPDGADVSGEDTGGPVQALRRLNETLLLKGIRLHAAGLDPRFYESGLSSQSSWGYLDGEDRAYQMMEFPPPVMLEAENIETG